MSANMLSAVRITRMVRALDDQRLVDKPLVWDARIPSVDAEEDEITAQFQDRVTIADVVNDDQSAGVYNNGKMRFLATNPLNLKHGRSLTQAEIRMLRKLQRAGSIQADGGFFLGREAAIAASLVRGVRLRKEEIFIGMLTDSWTYSRLGYQASVTWGMPSDLKVIASPTWNNATTAHPVQDIQTLLLIADERYDEQYDRVTISRQAFQYMIATDEFQAKAKVVLPIGFSFTNLITQDIPRMVGIAQQVLGLTIEIASARAWEQAEDGTLSSFRLQDISTLIFTETADDNNPDVWDWANGEVVEPLVGALTGVGNFLSSAPTRGPVAYPTGSIDLNPPSVTYWSVARGFPRRHRLTASAYIVAGAFTDSIPVTEPTWP